MKHKRRIIVSILWMIIGASLFICDTVGLLDPFWSGMGAALFAVGILQLIKQIRYMKDEEYREKVDIAENDERIRFISGQAHAWASYIYLLVAAIAAIGFRIAGQNDIAAFASISMAVMVVIYTVMYIIFSRKY